MPEIKTNTPVLRFAELRAALTPEQINNRQAEFVISTEAVDSYGTVFRLSGWDLKRYEKNPIVGYNHRLGAYNDDPDNVIGTSEVFVEENALIGRVTFESAEVNAKAEKIFQKVQSGTLRMASVGARPVRGHWGDEKLGEDPDVIYFDETTLFEWSVVDIGSNEDAVKRSADALDAIRAEIPKETEQTPPAADDIEVQRSFRERQLIINEFSN
jgi:HK97 family phage prohead protease